MEKSELSVPKFTAEDYISSSAPYEWLEQFRDDKFLLQQKMEQMKDVKVIGYITKPDLGMALITRDGNEFELKAQGWNPVEI